MCSISNSGDLKIEYEIFFNNPAKRPPTDVEWKVLSLIRSQRWDAHEFSAALPVQRNGAAVCVQSDLWRKKMRIREEGYRRPQEAILSVRGVRAAKRGGKTSSAYGLSRPAQRGGRGGAQRR